ncbi:MAG: hypothetical protein ACO23R_14190 [bacterium]|tara:strand:- start:190 stop:408 length:219 start_codon:yes stop_codon:yes gene_type:complete
MMGPEAATIILGPLKSKMGGSYETEEVSEEEMEEYEYSDEQKEMAKELVKAVKSGDEETVLMAIHGIMMSYD